MGLERSSPILPAPLEPGDGACARAAPRNTDSIRRCPACPFTAAGLEIHPAHWRAALMIWRAEDEALRQRLLDEEAMERLWRAQAPEGAALPHPRAAGMIARLRESGAEGAAAVTRLVEARDPTALIARMTPKSYAGVEPVLLHHLSVWYARLAAARAAAGMADAAVAADEHALAAWLALAQEGAYLERLAEAVIGGALPAAEVAAAVGSARLAPI